MTTDTQRGLSRADLRAERNRLAEAIAATEQEVAATFDALARTRPQDAARLLALSRRAAQAAAREWQEAQDHLRRSRNLMSDTQRIVRRSDLVMARTVQAVIAFAETEDKVADTFARLAATRPQAAAQLWSLSERAGRQAVRARQWAEEQAAAGTGAA